MKRYKSQLYSPPAPSEKPAAQQQPVKPNLPQRTIDNIRNMISNLKNKDA